MHLLTELLKKDMKPALGVTEPGAIAFAVSTAVRHIKGEVEHITLSLNSGMFKNAFTCGIPGSVEVGNYYAAALGAIAANPDKGLECLEGITKSDEEQARKMVKDNKITVNMSSISSRIFIEVKVIGKEEQSIVKIRDSHTNIVEIQENGKIIFSKPLSDSICENDEVLIHKYTLDQMLDYALTIPFEEISFIEKAYDMNLKLFEEGLKSEKTTYASYLLKKNGGSVISNDEQKTVNNSL